SDDDGTVVLTTSGPI
nr:RecName: Full=Rathke gland glycoprotein [Caretta caretta]